MPLWKLHDCSGHPRVRTLLRGHSTNTRGSNGQNPSNEEWSITNDHWVTVGTIKTQFAVTIDSQATCLASVSLAKFKLRWVKEETRRDHITLLLTTECRTLTTEEPEALMPDPPQPAAAAPSKEGFFSFDEEVKCLGWGTLVSGNRGNVLHEFCPCRSLFQFSFYCLKMFSPILVRTQLYACAVSQETRPLPPKKKTNKKNPSLTI